jgi:hypothetical protein
MPALPSPEPRFSWRRAAARQLRGAAAWLERGSGASRAPGASGSSGTFGATSPESPTPIRAFDTDGAPEHWVQMLRDAGLAPPVVRPVLRRFRRLLGANQAPQSSTRGAIPRSVPVPAPAPPASPETLPVADTPAAPTTPSVARPVFRLSARSRSVVQAPEHTRSSEAPFVARPALRVSEPSEHVEQAPQHTPTPVARPALRASEPTKPAEQAPQHTPTPVARPALHSSEPTKPAEQAPQHTPTPVARPALHASEPTKHAEQAPQHRQPQPELQTRPESQGHPSVVVNHAPASPVIGTWPELAPRPQPTQVAPTQTVEHVIARQARLHDEQLAI